MIILPFLIPEDELGLRLGRLLLLIEKLSFSKSGKLNLSLEKIAILEFLIKYPPLLNRVLILSEKKSIDLNSLELESIEALYPNRKLLFDFNDTKKILQILIGYKLIDTKIDENTEIFYYINADGIKYAQTLQSKYFLRLNSILEKAKVCQSETYSKINKQISPYINHGFRE